MKNYPGYLPQSHRILCLLSRVALLLWGIYGMFHGSVVEFLEAIFAILFTHLWDYFQVFGGRSFIIRSGYENQTMLNVFMFVCVVIGSTPVSYTHLDVYKRQRLRCVSVKRFRQVSLLRI